LALAAKVQDTAAVRHVNTLIEHGHFWKLNDFLKDNRLSIYRDDWARTQGAALIDVYRIDSRPPLPGEIVEIEARGIESGPGVFFSGRIRSVAGERMPEVILVTDKGRITGFARTYGRACEGCFSGYAGGAPGDPFDLFGLEKKDAKTARPILTGYP
jgi:hypothetical protein